jgi:Domain of unknown function (DUF397)
MTSHDNWRKSSYSGGEGGNCMEVADQAGRVLVRDTKQAGTSPVLTFTATAWQKFTGNLRAS